MLRQNQLRLLQWSKQLNKGLQKKCILKERGRQGIHTLVKRDNTENL